MISGSFMNMRIVVFLREVADRLTDRRLNSQTEKNAGLNSLLAEVTSAVNCKKTDKRKELP